MEQQAIITVKDLRTYFYSDKRCNKVLNGVSFELYKGRTLCVVGESGCGKSVTASSIMQLLPKLSRIESGAITYHSEKGDIRIDQLPRNGKEMRALRGRDIAMIFQDPIDRPQPGLHHRIPDRGGSEVPYGPGQKIPPCPDAGAADTDGDLHPGEAH